MKKAINLLLAASLLALPSCVIDGGWNGITGNGNVVEEERNVSGFTGVHVSSGIDVFLTQGPEFSVRVEADENLMEVIETRMNGDMLVVGTDRVNIRRARSKKVFVTLPELEELRISSAGDCIGETPFRCGELKLGISSAGDLTLEVEADRIHLEISSAGNARLAGSTRVLDASLSSSGDLMAFDLVAEKVDVRVSSSGDAKVHATEEISMSASSAGDIHYRGDPRVLRSSTSSAGDIIRVD